jgi:hypothetical protein
MKRRRSFAAIFAYFFLGTVHLPDRVRATLVHFPTWRVFKGALLLRSHGTS